MQKKIKVLIIDDSAFMRRVISDIINSDNRCQVVGEARNGKEGLKLAQELMPDVITLDVQMPVMNGLEMLVELNKVNPIPVIMLSTLMKEGGYETIQALELGAYDFVKKPDSIFKIDSDEVKIELIDKIIEASKSGKKQLPKPILTKKVEFNEPKAIQYKNKDVVNNLIAIGTSTGGPRALQYVLPYLPSNINAAIVIVQHMPPGFTKSLAERLNQLSDITIKEAIDKEIIENGTAYIAPGNTHLEVKEDANGRLMINLSDEPPRNGHKPSVNTMMNSIAKISNRKVIGVIMTGMGSDGMEGMVEVNEKQGMYIIAQNEETCVVYGMPKSVVEKGIADEVIPLEKIAESIIKQSGVL